MNRRTKMIRTSVSIMAGVCVLAAGCQSSSTNSSKPGWYSLFDGQSLKGWTASEHVDTFSVEDGCIVVNGDRSHLFYTGTVMNAEFKNFEWKADVMTRPKANSGMYIHTQFQESGWPRTGYEVQVNNSHKDWRRTGGLYGVVDIKESPVKDDEWFTQQVIVKGNRIMIKVNGTVTVDYTEPEAVSQNGQPGQAGRKLSSGTVALQGHDPDSVVYYKNITIKPIL
jgi:hypothetical protein